MSSFIERVRRFVNRWKSTSATPATEPPPLTCQELVELITDYLEGALSPVQRRRFEDHLSACDGCASYVEQMRATIRFSGRLREEDVPSEARDELLAAFRQWSRRNG